MAFDKEKIRKANRRTANSKREAVILLLSIVLAIITSSYMNDFNVSMGSLIFFGVLFALLHLIQQTIYYGIRDHDPADIRSLLFSRLGYLLVLNMYIVFSFTISLSGLSYKGRLFPGRQIINGNEEIVLITLFSSIYFLLFLLGLWIYTAYKKRTRAGHNTF